MKNEGPYLLQPATFTAAQDFFRQKANLPTALKSRQISEKIPAEIRGQAFFSAQVAKAHILEALRGECQAILDGEKNYTDGVASLRQFLAGEGYGIPEPKTTADRQLQNLASDSRLRLILEQNVAMADAVGQRMISEDPAVVERFPNYRYIKDTERHAEYHGLVLPKNHPFWQTHYPPWDFNCQCMVLDEEGESNGGDYGSAIANAGKTESGFEFLSSPSAAFGKFDTSGIQDPGLRSQVDSALAAREKAA